MPAGCSVRRSPCGAARPSTVSTATGSSTPSSRASSRCASRRRSGRIDADLRLGRAADVVEELGGLAREHPLDEGIRGQLMVALYRTGNQAEALATYQDVRRVARGGAGPRPVTQPPGARGRDPPPGPVAGPAGPGCRRAPDRRCPAGRDAGSPPRRGDGRLPVRRPRDVRRCTTRTSSSGASAWSPRWSRASRSTGSSGSSARRAAASRPRSGPGSCPPSRRAPSATRAGCARSSGRAPSRCASSIASCSRRSTSRSGRGCPRGRTRSSLPPRCCPKARACC